MMEVAIEPGMWLAGQHLNTLQLPPESVIISIRRQGELIFPRADVVLQAGDVVTFLVSPRSEQQLQDYLKRPAVSDTA